MFLHKSRKFLRNRREGRLFQIKEGKLQGNFDHILFRQGTEAHKGQLTFFLYQGVGQNVLLVVEDLQVDPGKGLGEAGEQIGDAVMGHHVDGTEP